MPKVTTPSFPILSEPSKPPGLICKTVPSVKYFASITVKASLFLVFIISYGISTEGILTSLVIGISLLDVNIKFLLFLFYNQCHFYILFYYLLHLFLWN